MTTTPPDLQQQHHDALVQEGKRKYSSFLEDHVLDYLHNNPIHIEACLSTCAKIFRNVVDNPTEEKFRRVGGNAASGLGAALMHRIDWGAGLAASFDLTPMLSMHGVPAPSCAPRNPLVPT